MKDKQFIVYGIEFSSKSKTFSLVGESCNKNLNLSGNSLTFLSIRIFAAL
jgi:hypothetical protein